MPYKTVIMKIDTETGEVVDERVAYGNYRVRLINENSAKAFRELEDGTLDIHRGERFGKYYPERIKHLNKLDLSPNEMRLIYTIMSKAMKYKTGELIEENNRLTNTIDLIQETGIELKRGRTALQSLVAKGIIDREPRGKGYKYYANPYIFVIGNNVNRELANRFAETDFAKIPEKRSGQDGE